MDDLSDWQRCAKGQMLSCIYDSIEKGQLPTMFKRVMLYSIDDFKHHMECQFPEGFTWENYGLLWCVDHKVPKSRIPGECHYVCWGLANLQPLTLQENQDKGDQLFHSSQEHLSKMLKQLLEKARRGNYS